MKTLIRLFSIAVLVFMISCNQNSDTKSHNDADHPDAAAGVGGQENVQDSDSQKDVVKVAMGSKDHTTLVAA
jgi:hypothetical protein